MGCMCTLVSTDHLVQSCGCQSVLYLQKAMSQQTTIIQPLAPLPLLSQSPSLLPFHINYTGPAPVSTYLLTRPAPLPSSVSASSSCSSSSSESLILSSFRGRQIVGQSLVLPSSYQGYILDVPPPPSSLSSSSDLLSKDLSQRGTTFGQSSLRLDQTQASGQPRTFARTRSATKRFFSEQEMTPSSTEASSFRAKQVGVKKQKVATKKFKLESDSEEDDDEKETQVEKAISTSLPTGTTSSTLTVSTVVTDSDSNTNAQEVESNPLSTISTTTTVPFPIDVADSKTTEATIAHSMAPSSLIASPLDQPIDPTTIQATQHLSLSSVPSVVPDSMPSDPSPPLSHSEETMENAGNIHDVDLDTEDDKELYTPSGPPPRELVPTHTFKNITIWTADDPVDRARDEFFRCFDVGGWIDLAEAIHSED